VTKTQSIGPISCLKHRATRVLHCTIVTTTAVLIFSLLLQSILSTQMRPRRLRGAWFSRLLRHLAKRRSGSILSPDTYTGDWGGGWRGVLAGGVWVGRMVLVATYNDCCRCSRSRHTTTTATFSC